MTLYDEFDWPAAVYNGGADIEHTCKIDQDNNINYEVARCAICFRSYYKIESRTHVSKFKVGDNDAQWVFYDDKGNVYIPDRVTKDGDDLSIFEAIGDFTDVGQ